MTPAEQARLIAEAHVRQAQYRAWEIFGDRYFADPGYAAQGGAR